MELSDVEIECINDVVDHLINSYPGKTEESWHVSTGHLEKLITETTHRLLGLNKRKQQAANKKLKILLMYPYLERKK